MAPPPSTTAKPAFGMQNGAPVSKAKRREKVALGPGYSPLDWARLTQSGRNLRGVEGPKRVTLDELAKVSLARRLMSSS
jgi:cytochrome b involved in lipid metabolism